MDNYTIVSIALITIIFITECIFSKNRKELVISLISLLKAILNFFTISVFQIGILYEVIVMVIIFPYFKLYNYTILKLIYSYLSFLILVIVPELTKISFNTKVYKLVTFQIIKKFTLVSIFTFIIKAFEPNLLVSLLIILFFIFKSFVEILSKKKVAFPLITNIILLILIYYSVSMFVEKLSYSLMQQLLISFMLPICFWLINIPLLVLYRYLMELDGTLNWIEYPIKLVLILKILIARIYWLIKLHAIISNINFDIVDVNLGGLGKKIYTITTARKLNKREQHILTYGYRYLILNAEFYKKNNMTFPIAINLVYKNAKYYNWHYKNIDPDFVDLVE